MRPAALALLPILVISCAGSPREPAKAAPSTSPSPPAAAGPSTAPSVAPHGEPVPGPPSVSWRDMTREQRARYMEAVVVPRMKEVFVAKDAKEYAGFGCETCHGKGADSGTFVMPNPDLLALPSDPAGFRALSEKQPGMVEFMSRKVKPLMATLLGRDEFDPAAPRADAVGCGTCHSTKK